MGSFVFGYCNNSIAGSFVQPSFVAKFLSGSNANAVIGGILGGFVYVEPSHKPWTYSGTDFSRVVW